MESQGNKIRMQRWQTRCQALLKGVILWVQKLWGIIYRPRPAHRSLVFSYRTDSTDSSDCLPIHLNISVFCFLIFSFFPLFTARCYASAVLAMGLCPSVCVCLSVTSRCSIKTAERIELVFGTWASFHPSYTVLKGNSVISKNKATSLWNFVLNSGLRKFRHGISIVETWST